MQLVEQQIISRDDPRFAKLDVEAFAVWPRRLAV